MKIAFKSSKTRLLIVVLSLSFMFSCGSDDLRNSDDPCDLYARTLTGTFVSNDNPEITLSFTGDGLSGSGTASSSTRTDTCSYRVENCTTGDVVGMCKQISEFGTVRIIDVNNIVVNNMFIEGFFRGDRGFTRI